MEGQTKPHPQGDQPTYHALNGRQQVYTAFHMDTLLGGGDSGVREEEEVTYEPAHRRGVATRWLPRLCERLAAATQMDTQQRYSVRHG